MYMYHDIVTYIYLYNTVNHCAFVSHGHVCWTTSMTSTSSSGRANNAAVEIRPTNKWIQMGYALKIFDDSLDEATCFWY